MDFFPNYSALWRLKKRRGKKCLSWLGGNLKDSPPAGLCIDLLFSIAIFSLRSIGPHKKVHSPGEEHWMRKAVVIVFK